MTSNIDLKNAIDILKEKNCSCVFCRSSEIVIKYESGIVPLLSLAGSESDYSGYCAADRIVGKAAALLYAYMNVRAVHGSVMSKKAIDVFNRFGVVHSFDILTEKIINRAGTGLCPMEEAVADIDDPALACAAIKDKLDLLKK